MDSSEITTSKVKPMPPFLFRARSQGSKSMIAGCHATLKRREKFHLTLARVFPPTDSLFRGNRSVTGAAMAFPYLNISPSQLEFLFDADQELKSTLTFRGCQEGVRIAFKIKVELLMRVGKVLIAAQARSSALTRPLACPAFRSSGKPYYGSNSVSRFTR